MRPFLLAALLAGCSVKPTPPVIDRVDLPASVTLGADNTYTVAITVGYHDDDDSPAVLRLAIPSLTQSFDEPLANAPFAGQLQATVHFPGNTSKGKQEIEGHVHEMMELFPELAQRRKQQARSLSGGQQQMLALARVLIHKPEVLMIDELSLGLAPLVVERCLKLVDDLRARGQTLLIVEQSLNVALSIADRAIFLEKGAVRFEGAAQDLLERDDLARAVFFGTEGG